MSEIHVGSILLHRCRTFGICRIWQVEALAGGGLKQESLVRLRSLSETPGVDEDGRKHETTVVPEALLRDLEMFHPALRDLDSRHDRRAMAFLGQCIAGKAPVDETV